MKASRITALGLVAGAALWIASGHLMPRDSADSEAAIRPKEAKAAQPFRVGVAAAKLVRIAEARLCPAAPRPTTRSPSRRAPAAS